MEWSNNLRVAGFIWGLGGVLLLLLSAIVRLSPRVLELRNHSMSSLHWLILVVFVAYMIYAEGYKGFHRNFSPRVALRAHYILQQGKVWMCFLAPFICMGYLHATRKRQTVSIVLTLGLIGLIILVSFVPQPWRGIVDAGVVLGLATGVTSLLWFIGQVLTGNKPEGISADLPGSEYPSV
jgi:drug/metabolite transporter (DMT)-like permease